MKRAAKLEMVPGDVGICPDCRYLMEAQIKNPKSDTYLCYNMTCSVVAIQCKKGSDKILKIERMSVF